MTDGMGERFTLVNGNLPLVNWAPLLMKVSVYTKVDFLRCMHVGVLFQVR